MSAEAPAGFDPSLADGSHRWWMPLISLLLIAILAGVAWRAELEYRSGWNSLKWLTYFHWAVPAGVLVFIGWVVAVARVRSSVLLTSALLVLAFLGYWSVEIAAHLYFDAGPSAFMSATMLGDGDAGLGIEKMLRFHQLTPLLWTLIPIAFCGLCRGFGVPISGWTAMASAALFLGSWPLAIYVRNFFETLGSPDLIHALKSGFVIPFLILSLGLPVVIHARRPAQST